MTDKTLTILISTYNERIKMLAPVISIRNANVNYMIFHQVDSTVDYKEWIAQLIFDRNDIQYTLLKSTGVTKSRNLALSLVKSDYALFTDDDIILAKDFYSIITHFFEKYSNASVLTFQAGNKSNGQPLKNYLRKSQNHTRLTILKVGTIEIAFNVKLVQSSGAQFPEMLGAGSSLPFCDEPVFLAELLSKGHRLIFVPQTIVYHPELSSGKSYVNENSLLSRGVAFRKIFGRLLSVPMIILFYLKNWGKFRLKNRSALILLCKGYLMTKFD